MLGVGEQFLGELEKKKMTHYKLPTPQEPRNMIFAMLFGEGDDDGDRFLALAQSLRHRPRRLSWRYEADSERDRCSLVPGRYHIDRAARYLATFPPVAARIA
jgi:hypothetical protein